MGPIRTLRDTSLALLACVAIANCVFLPPVLTGSYEVGIVSYELNNTSIEPSRDLIASIFYPTSACANSTHATAFGPQTNVYTDNWLSLPPGSSATVSMLAYSSTPILHNHQDFPVIFFGPGYGNSKVYYAGAAQDLASHGYIVVTMDHPIDSSFIEYPDARNATYIENGSQPLWEFVTRRKSDIFFILEDLGKHPRIPGFRGKLPLEKIGALGSSLGGCAAAALVFNDARFVAGVNMDGSMGFLGNTTLERDKPFLLLASTSHGGGDPTWGAFYNTLEGWKREIGINVTKHHHYSDRLYLANVLRPDGDPENAAFLSGKRMFVIETALLVSFFDKWLKGGEGSLLDGSVDGFPEIDYRRSSG
ncbi:hypothetical protein B0O99DRAFT_720773 [Bisporella sp. PMI_857]|nr:hypothetical protein B0O99DRAFT_720773 [Bisporella sp. PMI_857]